MKPARRIGLALAAVLPLLAACQALIGIGGDDFVVDDAGSSADGAEASTGDADPRPPACATGTQPVAQPTGATNGDDGARYVFAIRSIDVSGRTEAGAPTGFDLDRVCSCDATGAPSSCVVPDKPVVPGGCDDPGGVDNALFHIWNAVGSDYYTLLNKTVAKDLRCGHDTLLLVLSQYNGLADDSEVLVHTVESFGIRDDHDGGEPDGSPCGAASAYRPARWDGTDPWSVPTGAVAFGQPTTVARKGYVRDFQLVVDSRGQSTGPIVLRAVSPNPMNVEQAVITGKLVPLTDGGAAGFELTDGVLAGRVNANAFLAALAPSPVAVGAGVETFCGQAYWASLTEQLCAAVETLDDPTREFRGASCNAISMVLGFTAAQSVFGSPMPPPPLALPKCDSGLTCPGP